MNKSVIRGSPAWRDGKHSRGGVDGPTPERYPVESLPSMDGVRVLPVQGRRMASQFLKVPWPIYRDDLTWIPPLLIEQRQQVSSRNAFFRHAKACYWVAYRGNEPVGRVSAQVDSLHLERHADATGFFGLLEARDDIAVFRGLLGAAEQWLREQGLSRIRGPFSLSINEESGLLVEGFDVPPAVKMGHARPYYRHRLEACGYEKAKDLLAYRLDANFQPPHVMRATVSRLAARTRVRPLDWSRFDAELDLLRDIFNDAWASNWGFVPFTREEFRHVGNSLKMLVDPEFVQIAEVDGDPAAMIVLLPNVNEAIRDLNGRLMPIGWLKLLWRVKWRFPETARVPLMGVRSRYQGTALGSALAFLVVDALRGPGLRRGIRTVELSWILEDNRSMRNIIERIGGVAYKRYRVYDKCLLKSSARDVVTA